jgi:hypothetical protein
VIGGAHTRNRRFADVAEELRRRCELEIREIPPKLEGFFARYESDPRQLTLRLV